MIKIVEYNSESSKELIKKLQTTEEKIEIKKILLQ